MLCFDAPQIILIFLRPLSNPHWACDTSRRSYKATGCSINVNPHHIQRLQGSSIIHAGRRWTDWIVTTQAGTDKENERGMSGSLSLRVLSRNRERRIRTTATHPELSSTLVMWLIFALSDPVHVCVSNSSINVGQELQLAGLWYQDSGESPLEFSETMNSTV